MSFGSDHAVELAKLIAAMNATVVSARLSMAFPLRIFCFRRGHRSHMPALGGHCGTCRRRREDTFAWQRLKCRTCKPRCRRAVVANAPPHPVPEPAPFVRVRPL